MSAELIIQNQTNNLERERRFEHISTKTKAGKMPTLRQTLGYLLEAAVKFIIINSSKTKPLLLDHLASETRYLTVKTK